MKNFAIMLFAITLIFLGCSSEPDNHALDKSLKAPELYKRIGYSMEQIKFWHSQNDPMFTDYTLQTASDSELVYAHKKFNDLKIDYLFKNNISKETGMSCETEGKKSTLSVVETYITILNNFDFTIIVDKKWSSQKFVGYVIRSHETIPNLRARYFIGELPSGTIFHRVAYYYEGKK